MKILHRILIIIGALAALAGCGGTGGIPTSAAGADGAVTAVAASVVSGAAGTPSSGAAAMSAALVAGTAGGGASVAPSPMPPEPAPGHAPSCPTSCSVDSTGKQLTLLLQGCSYGGHDAIWQGSEVLLSSTPVACGTPPSEAAGTTLLRTFGPNTYHQLADSVHVTRLDTTQPSGYAQPVSGGTEYAFGDGGAANVTIHGIHVSSERDFRGNGNEDRVETAWDETVSTPVAAPLRMTPGPAGRVFNGTVIVQHNIGKYTGTITFKDVVFASGSGCCFPQSGTITATLSGSRTGTQTLTFEGSGCGGARYRDDDDGGGSSGGEQPVTLGECF